MHRILPNLIEPYRDCIYRERKGHKINFRFHSWPTQTARIQLLVNLKTIQCKSFLQCRQRVAVYICDVYWLEPLHKKWIQRYIFEIFRFSYWLIINDFGKNIFYSVLNKLNTKNYLLDTMSFRPLDISTTVVSPTTFRLLWHFDYCRFAYDVLPTMTFRLLWHFAYDGDGNDDNHDDIIAYLT